MKLKIAVQELIKNLKVEIKKSKLANKKIVRQAKKNEQKLQHRLFLKDRELLLCKAENLRLRRLLLVNEDVLPLSGYEIPPTPSQLFQIPNGGFNYSPPSNTIFEFFDPNADGAEQKLVDAKYIVLYRTSTSPQTNYHQVYYTRLVFGPNIVELFEQGVSGTNLLEERPTQQYHMYLCDMYRKPAVYPWASRVTRRGVEYGLFLRSKYRNGFFLTNNPPPELDLELYILDLHRAQTLAMYRSNEAVYFHQTISGIINRHCGVIQPGGPVHNEDILYHDVLLPLNLKEHKNRPGNKAFVYFVFQKQEEFALIDNNLVARRVLYHRIVMEMRSLNDPSARFLRKNNSEYEMWEEIGCVAVTEIVSSILREPHEYTPHYPLETYEN